MRSEIHHGNAFGLTTAISVRRVTVEDSGRWLAAGWADLCHAPVLSLSWGVLFVAISHALFFGLAALGLDSLILPLAAGFMLVGPLAAVGLYEISRRLEKGEPLTLAASVMAWRRNSTQIGLMGVLLLVAMFAWIQVALVLFAMFFHGSPPTLAAFLAELTGGLDNVPFLAVGAIAGGLLAAAVFSVSVISLPMLLDRDVTAADAVAASLMAVRANWRVMIGWAATIAVIAGMGLATFFIGLAVALPLLGHASWHAYRSLVAEHF